MKRTVFTSVLVAVMLMFLGSCALNPATGRSELALMSMSVDEEVALGRKMFPEVLQKMGGEYPDPDLQAYVQSVGDRLKSAGYRKDIQYTFRVVNDSSPNAFALPGGYIAITRGLLTNLENEAQLAAVLGHEIGHVDATHALQGLQRSNLLGLGLAVLSGVAESSQYSGLIRQSGEVAATLIDRSYSREQESESDRLGIDYMVKSGYSPAGAVELQEIFVQKIEKRNDPMWLEGFFRTHPFSQKRLEENRRYIAVNYPGLSLGGIQSDGRFRQATERLRKVAPGYEKFDQAVRAEKNGSPQKAIELYLKAAALAPDEALILSGLGLAYLRLEDLVSAKQHLARAVNLDGDYYLSRLGLAYVYLERKDFPSAVRHAEKSFELLPTVESVYFAARSYEGSNQPEKALERYRVVARSAPDSTMGKHSAERIKSLEPIQ